MSSADPEEVSVEIEREGVAVEKSFEPDDFPVPAIAFVIRSERDVPVDVRLVDTVPEDIQAEDIGFHPKYGAEHWRNEGDELIFERTFEAGEEYTTVYGLRARDTEDVGRFLGDPELAEVDPPKDSSQVVRDVISEGGDGTEPGASDDDLEAAIAAADVEGTPESQPASDPAGPSGTASVSPGAASVASGDVASMLAQGIRDGEVDDSDLEVLRDALGTEGGSSKSLEVRIDHLQSEVADLEAYTDALEEFIDENGEARTLMRDLQDSIDGIRDDVAGVEERVESVSGEVSEASGRLEDLSEEVSRIDDVESSLESVESSVETVDQEVTSIREEMDGVRDEVEEVRAEIPEGRIDEIDDRMEELEAELRELAEMRQRMASVFGGMGGSGGDEGGTEESEADDGADEE
jgi:phage shock protein A